MHHAGRRLAATPVGYGDLAPVGIARAVGIAEAVAGLLLFGAVVSKFVSRRQEELVREIHRVTFEERLDRAQTSLHLVLSELQAIADSLASLASALHALREVFACLPSGFRHRSQTLSEAIHGITRLAEEICGDCVPHDYAPGARTWMDRIQQAARELS